MRFREFLDTRPVLFEPFSIDLMFKEQVPAGTHTAYTVHILVPSRATTALEEWLVNDKPAAYCMNLRAENILGNILARQNGYKSLNRLTPEVHKLLKNPTGFFLRYDRIPDLNDTYRRLFS